MSEVVIYGFDASNYVRTVRLACAEKNVPYELSLDGLDSPASLTQEPHLSRHPFGKIPSVRHKDTDLYETSAICRYIDAVFDGPALQPESTLNRIVMEQWISALNDYTDKNIIRRFVLEIIFPKGEDGNPVQETLDAAVPDIERDLAVYDKALAGGPYFFGDQITIPDLLLLPMVDYLAVMPGGAELLSKVPQVKRFHETFKQRPSYASTLPERLKQAS